MLLVSAAAFAAVDLTVKAIAESRLGEASVDLGVLQLRLLFNNGVAFGLGDMLPTSVLVAFTAALTAAMGLYGWRHAPHAGRVQRLAGGAVIGGAVANVIDRTTDGAVTDYLHTGWWPTFNLADTLIVVGLIVLALTSRRDQRPTGRPSPGPGSASDSGRAIGEPRILDPW